MFELYSSEPVDPPYVYGPVRGGPGQLMGGSRKFKRCACGAEVDRE